MKYLLLIALLAFGALCLDFQEQLLKDLFEQWKQIYEKCYPTTVEHDHRFNVFIQNYLSIVEYNSQDDSVTLGLNQFADLTPEEFKTRFTYSYATDEPSGEYFTFDESQDPPASVDWRQKGAVTPIKNQGDCGSCWAFSATGALEGLYYINNSKLIPFSEQNIIDCDKQADACRGGWPIWAFNYTSQGGIEIEANYPYRDNDFLNCTFNQSQAYNVNSGFYNITPNNITQLKLAVAQQPVSILIQGDSLNFQYYKKGVIKRWCGAYPDHAVLAVGYEVIKGEEALIVKNSWGTKWGQEGYVYISTNPAANNGSGVCGILTGPSIPYKN